MIKENKAKIEELKELKEAFEKAARGQFDVKEILKQKKYTDIDQIQKDLDGMATVLYLVYWSYIDRIAYYESELKKGTEND